MPPILNQSDLASHMRAWARELGFLGVGIASVDLSHAEAGLLAWLANGFQGEMAYMQTHGLKRARPAELIPGTVSVVTLQMPYLPQEGADDWIRQEQQALETPGLGVVSVYARGRDYHKVLRRRLQQFADRLGVYLSTFHVGGDAPYAARVFTDSAPVLEVELAQQSGQGWRGKHTLLLRRDAGSMLFLGEIYVNVALEPSVSTIRVGAADSRGEAAVQGQCGTCQRCLTVCPTQAIIAPYRLDARRCISYLTIEHPGAIPLDLRGAMGNRIYGCDDCQLVCPWNKFAIRACIPDFDVRHALAPQALTHFMGWSESDFLMFTEGSPIRRIGYERWQRNVAVACGNALASTRLSASDRSLMQQVLTTVQENCSALVAEHIQWALAQTQS